METTRKTSSLTRSGSSKSQVQNLVEKGRVRPESFKRFQSDYEVLGTKIQLDAQRMTHNHNMTSYENLDTFFTETNLDLDPHDPRRNNSKLFPKSTSTTELFNKNRNPLFRSTSSIGSSSLSGSETLSSNSSSSGIHFNMNNPFNVNAPTVPRTSSGYVVSGNINQPSQRTDNDKDVVIIRRGSNSEGGQQQRRKSRFSEYISSTSSWEWEDEEYPESIPVLPNDNRFVFPERNVSSFHDHGHNHHHGVERQHSSASSSSTRTKRNEPTPSTSSSSAESSNLAAAGISSTSCPSLDTMGVRRHSSEFKSKVKQGFGLSRMEETSSVSTTEIDAKFKERSRRSTLKKKGGMIGIVTSKSSGCIWAAESPCSSMHLKRPVTLRFTPSGLQESSRVVWCSETGDHSGTVRWVGTIRDNYYAGVEFDKSVGNSSGIYGYGHGLQIRLFTCKLGYGRFVPVEQLILYEDFYESQKTGFICIICRDDFIEPGQAEQGFDKPENFMLATKCGHLFHQICLNTWFNEKPSSFQHCPYCQIPMERNDTIRIFPAQLK